MLSRNRPNIEKWLRSNDLSLKISLELNSYYVLRAVNAFINFKVLQTCPQTVTKPTNQLSARHFVDRLVDRLCKLA
jgi:hypothetical protein